MILEENIREWQQSIADNHCRECPDSCCNLKKHIIPIRGYSLSVFKEKGVPIIEKRKLNKSSLKEWKKNHNKTLFFADGSKVSKPSVIDTGGFFLDEFYMYADSCPFYEKNKGCEIHEDERRPSDCEKYPLAFLGCNDKKGRLLDIMIMKTCEYFNREEIKSELLEKFPVRIIN